MRAVSVWRGGHSVGGGTRRGDAGPARRHVADGDRASNEQSYMNKFSILILVEPKCHRCGDSASIARVRVGKVNAAPRRGARASHRTGVVEETARALPSQPRNAPAASGTPA